MGKIRTIFITSFYGLIGRNLLSTSILPTLFKEAPEARVVIILPEEKERQYREMFGSDRIVIAGVPTIPETAFELFLAKLFFFLPPTESARIARDAIRVQGKPIHAFFWSAVSLFGRVKMLRQLARLVVYWLMPKRRYAKFFDQYKPDLVFATDIFRHQDVDILREAKSRGVKTVGMVRSWDNISTKGLNHHIPDHVVVQAEKMKEDIIAIGDVNPGKISIVGVPHYDYYATGKRTSREEFFKSMDLDPKKKTVIISPPLRHYTTDPIPEVIFNALASQKDLQFIIRMTLVGKSNIGNLKPISGKLAIDAPASAEDFNQADITAGDKHLADLLYHSDAIISHISTIAIDGVVFDKPAFFAGFNAKPTPYHQGIRWFFDMDCARDLIATGAVKLAESVEELVDQLLPYLSDKTLGAKEREFLRERYCYKLDGKSGERLGSVLAGLIK